MIQVTLAVGLGVGSADLYGALWAAVHEVAALFLREGFHVDCVALHPSPARLGTLAPTDRVVRAPQLADEEFWLRLSGAPRRRPNSASPQKPILKAGVLGATFQELVRPLGPLVVLTDAEILPPPGLRYIIWDDFDGGTVISAAPTSAAYWGERAHDDIATIKRRVRAAAISAVGEHLGLRRCDNAHCYLYSDIESVMQLDDLVHVGAEHGRGALTGYGFDPELDARHRPEEVMKPERVRAGTPEGGFTEGESA